MIRIFKSTQEIENKNKSISNLLKDGSIKPLIKNELNQINGGTDRQDEGSDLPLLK